MSDPISDSNPGAGTTPSRPWGWKVVNVLTFIAVLVVNGTAGAGTLSGESIGVIANRYINAFLPANYVFGIWSLIYLGLFALTIFQALPTQVADRTVRALGPLWLLSGVLNMGWIVAFAFSRFVLAMLVMVALLVVLVQKVERLHALGRAGWATRLCATDPMGLYLAWISVAVIANSFQLAHVVGFGGLGLSETVWAVTMMIVATALGWLMVSHRGVWLFPLVVAWALRGIGHRFPDDPVLSTTTGILVPIGIAGGALLVWDRWRRSRQRTASA